jgi:hypothetical protein
VGSLTVGDLLQSLEVDVDALLRQRIGHSSCGVTVTAQIRSEGVGFGSSTEIEIQVSR